MEERQRKEFREEELQAFEQKLAERREALGAEGKEERYEDREALRELVREEMERGEEPSAVPPPAAPPAPKEVPLEEKDDLDKIRALPEDRRLHALIDVAFAKSVKDAIRIVRRMKDPYIIDAFHDAIVDALYAELVRRGKLKM